MLSEELLLSYRQFTDEKNLQRKENGMNQRKLKGVNYRNQSTIAKLLMCAFRFVIPFPSFVVGTRGTSDDIYSQTTDSAASLMQSVAWPPPGLCARCGVQGLPGVPSPPGLRPGSMAPRFPSWGGQGSWHAGRMQPACSQVSRVSCSQRLSHPLPQVKKWTWAWPWAARWGSLLYQ